MNIEPYYADESVRLYLGDCREVTQWLAGDALVTDPPYGTQLLSTKNSNPGGYGRRGNRVSGRRQSATIVGDDTTEVRDAVLSMWGDRQAVIFASPRLPEPPGIWEDRAVWDKRRPGTNGGPFRYVHEMIYSRYLTRVDDRTFSIISAHPDQADHIHAKPLAVMSRLVALTVGVIADPFAGSGSTLVAAKRSGRQAVGVEIDERYCEIAALRLSQGVLEANGAAPVSGRATS